MTHIRNGIGSDQWKQMSHDERKACRAGYAAQFGRSWVDTVLAVRRRRGIAYVWIRLKARRPIRP